ncbi:hypothetical protein PBCV1_A240aL [Paramecium bursaria Chlorella virus 1]|uniref:Uncharacterized protein n=1 Tax=Paramecium bursaria Chlorella virus 1 TaxID=10506 RepID=F8TU01_PBCV1|nr:hypothetical protein PBCV1_A240aL [Paramecium bursaria Chlorella virus 1]AEI70062.1 hypothetical protein [Paramecium bursaria Chlorella virus 1]
MRNRLKLKHASFFISITCFLFCLTRISACFFVNPAAIYSSIVNKLVDTSLSLYHYVNYRVK